jgi:hypothetical protein
VTLKIITTQSQIRGSGWVSSFKKDVAHFTQHRSSARGQVHPTLVVNTPTVPPPTKPTENVHPPLSDIEEDNGDPGFVEVEVLQAAPGVPKRKRQTTSVSPMSLHSSTHLINIFAGLRSILDGTTPSSVSRRDDLVPWLAWIVAHCWLSTMP